MGAPPGYPAYTQILNKILHLTSDQVKPVEGGKVWDHHQGKRGRRNLRGVQGSLCSTDIPESVNSFCGSSALRERKQGKDGQCVGKVGMPEGQERTDMHKEMWTPWCIGKDSWIG